MFPRRCLDPLGSVFYVKKIVDVAQFKGYDFEIRKMSPYPDTFYHCIN